MNDISIECPSILCSAVDPEQMELEAAVLASAGVTDRWAKAALRCNGCGVVHSRNDELQILRGYFDSPILGVGWRPIVGRFNS